ncbi:hypothetical protein CPB86DRAFT_791720, partial [Serendipita vermifera]
KEQTLTCLTPAIIGMVAAILALASVAFDGLPSTPTENSTPTSTFKGCPARRLSLWIAWRWLLIPCCVLPWPGSCARLSMILSSLLQRTIATILIAINWQPYATATFTLHQHVGALLFTTAMFSFGICCTIKEGDRINKVFTRFIIFYTILACFTVFMLFVILGLAIHLLLDKSLKALVTSATLTCETILSGCALVLFMPPPSSLALINKYGKRVPDAPSGESAISLMQAYAQANILGMKCIVLHVPEKSVLLNSMTANYTYEDDWAWRNLDMEHMAIRHRSTRSSRKRLPRPRLGQLPMVDPLFLSRPSLRPKSSKPNLNLLKSSSPPKHSRSRDSAVVSSVVLLVRDRSSSLCVTFGLLAFHWPFRSATFYTSSTKRPIARSAAVLRAIAEWNEQRPRKERCAVLLEPTYQHGDGERAIAPSGWTATPLPSSHVVDLQAYKNKTVAEYLKAIQYRDQEGNFKKANGEVVESTDFTDDQCAVVMRLWHQIAEKRTGEGETAVLATPDESMLMQLSGGSKGDRSLLFLHAENKTIASCVLFRLGDTITSDLQGLDYELAHPLKAYFVMMQHTIGIALPEGKSFVDFGPTTPKPKLDIGCTSVEITGAMAATRIAANKVTEGMQAKE